MISKACSWLVLMMFMVLGSNKSLCFSQQTCISRCGKLSISHPFRLKGDPENCGISMYELECVKDVAMLWLTKEAEYRVEAINYKNYTIRLVDPNIEEDDCSSLPRHLLYRSNFSNASDYEFAWKQRDVDNAYHATQLQDSVGVDNAYYIYLSYPGLASKPLFENIIYMSCNTSVTEYQREYEFFFFSSSVLGFTYLCCCWGLDDETVEVLLPCQANCCHICTLTPPNVSYADIHRSLAYEFELSWLHFHCNQHCRSRTCYFNCTTQNPYYFSHCDVVRILIHCGKQLLTLQANSTLSSLLSVSLFSIIFITLLCMYIYIYEISLGIARGISYVHEGCDMQILHFDIKTHSILLDENFIPKISDFGLAKLYPKDNSIMISLTDRRGTIGYTTPELFYNNIGGVSYKADLYSFGMLLMEMANRRKNLNPHAKNSSSAFFPSWIYNQFSNNGNIELDNMTEDEKKIFKKMIIIALWCIHLKPCDHPSMQQVVEMLEEEAEDLTMPPKPTLYPSGEEELELKLDQTSTSHYDSECANNNISEIEEIF